MYPACLQASDTEVGAWKRPNARRNAQGNSHTMRCCLNADHALSTAGELGGQKGTMQERAPLRDTSKCKHLYAVFAVAFYVLCVSATLNWDRRLAAHHRGFEAGTCINGEIDHFLSCARALCNLSDAHIRCVQDDECMEGHTHKRPSPKVGRVLGVRGNVPLTTWVGDVVRDRWGCTGRKGCSEGQWPWPSLLAYSFGT